MLHRELLVLHPSYNGQQYVARRNAQRSIGRERTTFSGRAATRACPFISFEFACAAVRRPLSGDRAHAMLAGCSIAGRNAISATAAIHGSVAAATAAAFPAAFARDGSDAEFVQSNLGELRRRRMRMRQQFSFADVHVWRGFTSLYQQCRQRNLRERAAFGNESVPR